MYQYTPPRKGRGAGIVSFAALIFAAAGFVLSTLFRPVWLYQLIAVLCLFVFIQIVTKYLLTQYSYLYQDGILIVVQRQGKKEKEVGNLRISASSRIRRKSADGAKGERESYTVFCSYCANLFAKNTARLYCEEGGKGYLLEFEPDEKLYSLIEDRISELKEHEE